jgi:hypothetical protein
VLETFALLDEHTSLEVRERSGRESVLILMNSVNNPDEDAAWIELADEQWRYLCGLDYVDIDPPADPEPPAVPESSDTIH